MTAETREKLFKYGLAAGLVLIAILLFAYAREFIAPLTAEKIVAAEREKAALPMDINPSIRWESIEAGPQRVIYTYTVRGSPRDREALENALRQQITKFVCAEQLYREAVKNKIAFEFIYKFADETHPALSLSPGECGG
ncbi:MAG TPA: hypothetical protein VGL70_17950 [Candidatus Binatia bacterium]|jgi:hypothetical protein